MKPADSREINIFDRKDLLKGKQNIGNIVTLLKENNQIQMNEKWFDKFSNWIYPPLHKIEDGIKLTRHCQKLLTEAELKIEKLVDSDDGSFDLESFVNFQPLHLKSK